jgi:hypothetical protein
MFPEAAETHEVRCADVHPVRCDVSLRASSHDALSDGVRAHGAIAHGFTPAWYGRERMASLTDACVTRIVS